MGNPPAIAVRSRYHRELALTDVVGRHVVFSDEPFANAYAREK